MFNDVSLCSYTLYLLLLLLCVYSLLLLSLSVRSLFWNIRLFLCLSFVFTLLSCLFY